MVGPRYPMLIHVEGSMLGPCWPYVAPCWEPMLGHGDPVPCWARPVPPGLILRYVSFRRSFPPLFHWKRSPQWPARHPLHFCNTISPKKLNPAWDGHTPMSAWRLPPVACEVPGNPYVAPCWAMVGPMLPHVGATLPLCCPMLGAMLSKAGAPRPHLEVC